MIFYNVSNITLPGVPHLFFSAVFPVMKFERHNAFVKLGVSAQLLFSSPNV